MEININKLLAQNIVYMRKIGAYGMENFHLMAKMKEWVNKNNLWNGETVIFAVAWDNPAITSSENCRYDVCLAVEDGFSNTDDVKKGTLPSGTYAIFKVVHTSEAVQQFYESVFNELGKSGYSLDTSRPIMERYANKMIDSGFCEFCVPVLA